LGLARVAVLFYRIGPYHYARLRAAGAVADVTAIEFSNVDPTYAWDEVKGEQGFRRVTLYRDISVESQSARQIYQRMAEVLDQVQPGVVAIAGWSDRCSLAALRWALKRSVPVVLMSETTAWDEKRRWWKEAIKRGVLRLCGAALVGGRAHLEYAAQLGMPRDRIFLGYDAVDNEFFSQKADEARREEGRGSRVEQRRDRGGADRGAGSAMSDNSAGGTQRTETNGESDFRTKYGLPVKYFLAAARFIEKKNLLCLLDAYSEYVKRCEGAFKAQPWSLVLLGDGPLREKIQMRISALDLCGHVHLPGFKQYPELPVYYALASAFVHASTVEQWGLVVNEAMASGLPVLLSNRCGCTADLLEAGRNGLDFDPDDSGMIAQRMFELSSLAEAKIRCFGAASKEIIARWGPQAFAEGLRHAVETAGVAGAVRRTWRREAFLGGLTWAVS
jgi:glycosyltransferase involved in cell wall biosynthesis